MMDGVYICRKPDRIAAPLVLDSPHSGNVYPPDFHHACPRALLRDTEDAYVDDIFGAAPDTGVPLLSALFPRCYIDANRAPDDIDPLLLSSPWPGARPGPRSDMGLGLVRRLYKHSNPTPIYDEKLSPADIRARIDGYYTPYHDALKTLLDTAFDAYGAVFHLNCHSMPSQAATARLPADIVLGDRDGTTCDSAFTRFAAKALRGMGYRVALNSPYKGVELVRRYSDPRAGRHSLQIEIDRRLYMDEWTREKTHGFNPLKRDMTAFIGQLVDFSLQYCLPQAAE